MATDSVGGPAGSGAGGRSFGGIAFNGGSVAGVTITIGGNGVNGPIGIMNNGSSTDASEGQQDDESIPSDNVEQPIVCGDSVHLPTDLIPFTSDAINDKHVRKYI